MPQMVLPLETLRLVALLLEMPRRLEALQRVRLALALQTKP